MASALLKNTDKCLNPKLHVENLGLQEYTKVWNAMKEFTHERTSTCADTVWFCEHEAVYTLGQAGKPEHVLDAHDIPVVNSDRGGQVTYHGPGFLMMYCLFDLQRLALNTREFVCLLEQIVIELLSDFNIKAYADRNAPGVYVDNEKIASLGLRIRKGYSYHGLCVNVNGDLTPFQYINPCGIPQQKITSLKELGNNISMKEITERIEIKTKQHYDRILNLQ